MASISMETKIHAVEQCYAGAGSLNQIAERFGVHRSTLQKWLLNYNLFAPSCRESSLSSNCKAASGRIVSVWTDEYRSGLQKISAAIKITAGTMGYVV